MFTQLVSSILYITVFITLANASLGNAQDLSTGNSAHQVQKELVPNHEIKYQETRSPDWKVNWDLARALYRDKKYSEALVQYEILLTQKGNIDEARWEYVSILMYLERWDGAKEELEKLLASEPESMRYSLAMARVSMKSGNIDNAVARYMQLHGKPVTGDEKVTVLEGLVAAYEALGDKEKAVLYLEELIFLKPLDPLLHFKLATLELARGNAAKAKDICINLERSSPHDIDVLGMLARIEVDLKNNDKAADYWRRILAIDPDHIDAHSKLSAFYFDEGDWAKSFDHLKPLIKITPTDVSMLGQAAELYMKMDRVDRALEYYEYGLAVDPLNRDIADGKSRAQKILAKDLLAIVENEGSNRLWQDLVKVTPDFGGVYREIANLLREKGNKEELIEVLTLLSRQIPEDTEIQNELLALQGGIYDVEKPVSDKNNNE